MNQDFTPIFEYIDKSNSDLRESLINVMDEKISTLQVTVDAVLREVIITRQELTSMTHRMDKFEEWAKLVSSKVGIPLNL